MNKHFINTILLTGIFIITLCSCAKNENPVNNPAQLSTKDAKSQLAISGSQFKADSLEFTQLTTSVTGALNYLSIFGVPNGNGFSNIYSLRVNSTAKPEVLSIIAKQLADIGLSVSKLNQGARIPNSIESAKGIWEFGLITSPTSVLGYKFCPSTSLYYIQTFERTGDSDDIVVKFYLPSSDSLDTYSDCPPRANNAVYTISNLKTTAFSFTITANGSNFTISDTIPTSLSASLDINGVNVLTYRYSTNLDFSYGSNPSALSVYIKIYNYEYNYDYNISDKYTSGSLTSIWKKDGIPFSGNKKLFAGNGYSPAGSSSPTSLSSYFIYETLTYYWSEYTNANIKINGSINPKAYLSEVQSKYNAPLSSGYYDSTTYKAILKDTVLTDKYYNNFAAYESSTGAKIGDLKLRFQKNNLPYAGINVYSYYSGSWYIYYQDGSNELLSNLLPAADFYENVTLISYPYF